MLSWALCLPVKMNENSRRTHLDTENTVQTQAFGPMEQLELSLLIRLMQGIHDTKSRARLACVCKVSGTPIIVEVVVLQSIS